MGAVPASSRRASVATNNRCAWHDPTIGSGVMIPWRPLRSSCARLARHDGSFSASGTSSCARPRSSPSSAWADSGVVTPPSVLVSYPPSSRFALSLTSPWMAVLSSWSNRLAVSARAVRPAVMASTLRAVTLARPALAALTGPGAEGSTARPLHASPMCDSVGASGAPAGTVIVHRALKSSACTSGVSRE